MDINDYINGYTDIASTNYSPDKQIGIDRLICPCCGKKLRLVDSSKNEFDGDDLLTVNESTRLNENKLADYLLEIIEAEAKDIFEAELETNVPETDTMGNIVDDYGERFLYVSRDLKKIIKMKANAISNMVKAQGISVSPYYIENELFQVIKSYANIGKR